MRKKKKYALGAGGAILKWLCILPGIVICLMGGCSLAVGGAGASATVDVHDQAKSDIRKQITEAGFSQAVADDILDDGILNKTDKTTLTDEQKIHISGFEAQYLGTNIGTGLAGATSAAAGGLGIAGLVIGFIIMALGLVLGIRKNVLSCDSCGVTISAG